MFQKERDYHSQVLILKIRVLLQVLLTQTKTQVERVVGEFQQPISFSGYVLATVLVLSPNGGVNAAMDAWGDVLLAASGKARYAYKRDFANQFLGYSTE